MMLLELAAFIVIVVVFYLGYKTGRFIEKSIK
jgi:hypothetical protein